jgi:beta-lactamase regulating signal transducer with metallopeptidase domain
VIAAPLDHIWQSSLIAGGIALLTLLFRGNGAAVRFWLWFVASLKFLVPFAVLAVAGEYFSRLFPASLPRSILAIQPAAEKLSAPAGLLVAQHGQNFNLVALLLSGWLMGLAVILGLRLLRWVRLRAVLAEAHDLPLPAPIKIKASPSLLEPGLVGILEPAVLLPVGLMARLSEQERDSILAHELSHLRRHDNVTAAIHMLVEALFWFYPPVWLIGARLIAERERACDENVLASGHDPEVYAGGILKVCKFCIQSPLACAPGASGANLRHRVRLIMTAPASLDLTPAKRLLLAGAATLILFPPIMAGFVNIPIAVQVKRNVIAVQARAERAVTAVVEQIGMVRPAQVAVKRLPRLKVAAAAPPPLPQVATAAPPPLPQVDVAATSVPQGQPPAPEAASAPNPPEALASVAASPRPVTKKDVVLALDPVGAGDPDAITCRLPQLLPGSRILLGPTVCQTNRIWADMQARHEDVSPDGKTVVYLDGFERQRAAGQNCNVFYRGGNVITPIGLSAIYCF